MKLKQNLTINNLIANDIINYALDEKVCYLSVSALNGDDVIERINKLELSLNYVIKKLKYISSLTEQIYSDMDFDNLTDPKKSNSLNEFHKRIRNNYIDD